MSPTAHRIRPSPIAAAIWVSLLAPQAFAQTTTTTTSATPAEQEVVISGSRIKRDTFTSTAPLQILRNDDAALAGFTSTAEVLQGTAVTGGQGQINNAYGGFVVDGGPGANTLGLRGFGPTRSLVLLNGRRMAPSGTRGSVGAADLNTLPDAIVDRIELLKDGASSIYGSDAIAGVVNVITKRNITSVTAGLKLGVPSGGGEEARFSLVGGLVKDNAWVSGSYEYYERSALTLGDRDWTRCNTDYRRTSTDGVVGQWGSWDYVDPTTGKPKCYPITASGAGSNGVTVNTLGTPSAAGVAAAGATGTRFVRWRPNASVTTGLVGYEGVGGNINVRDVFEPRKLNESLISPTRNHNVFVQGGVDLKALGDAELYYEAMYNRRESSQVGFRQLSLDYNKGSPLIPAGLVFASNFLPSSDTSGGRPVGVRAFVGFGNDQSTQTIDFTRAVVGLRGSLLKTGWEYDAVLTHSQSRGDYTFQSFLTDRMIKSLHVVQSGSGFNCVDPSNGCVAAPALTPAVLGGQLPQDWVNYVFRPVTGITKYKESTATVSATGTIFQLPYGKLKGAVGVELRQAEIDDTPPPESQAGNLLNLTSAVPTRGKDKVVDVFAEVDVPLLANLPFVHELTANVSGRWSNYDSYGSGSTYKLGALWSPAKWVTLRATQGTSFRAPALYEQFLGATSGFSSSSNDPCNQWDAPGKIGSTRSNNCASEGLPAGYDVGNGNNQSIRVFNTGGATSGLKAETSDNLTVGLVFQPTLGTGFGDLSLAVDFFNIQVDNGVSRVSTSSILSRCYDSVGFREAGGFCRLVDPRNPANNALTVNNSFVNLATDVVRGLDYTLRYTNNIGPGKLRVNATVTEYRRQANKLFAEDGYDETNGTIGSPKLTGNLDVYYDYKGWRGYYGLDWVGKMDSYAYLGEDPATSIYLFKTPSHHTHTVSLRYAGDKWSVTGGVRNLTDKAPPSISSGAYGRVGNAPLYSGYDYVGRTFFLNASKTF
jgi:iron complex outermembrane receptor protein